MEVWIAEKDEATRTLVWGASARNQDGVEVLQAVATLKFPRRRPPAAA
jgi:3-hydroxybutyryl-CoA dehydratase